MTKRQYLTKDEAVAKGWYCRSDLKRLFRLKPGPEQQRVGQVWQGRGLYAVYDKSQCIPMRPQCELTAHQCDALAAGRTLRGTRVCKTCRQREATEFMLNGVCYKCRDLLLNRGDS